MLLQTYLVTVAIHWQDQPESVTERYERLEKIRYLSKNQHLLLQEEARPLGIALFDQPSLTVHLGFDQANIAESNWYQQTGHPYLQAVSQILDEIATLPYIQKMEFLIATGSDPLSNLQVQLDRQTFSDGVLPSSLQDNLHTQHIYSFSK
jgi:3,4-dihydroxy 2-butanone 4-phosphate synthase/GTP cyclohydrolase II